MKCNYITHRSEGIFVIYLLTLFCPNVHGQMLSLPNGSNFYDYIEASRNSYSYDEADTTEGGFKAQLTRLELQWGSRLYPHGDFSIANRAMIDYAQNYQYSPSNINPNWVCVGPSNTPNNDPRRGVGQIHRITFDPNYGINNQTIYVSSGFGGLWRTEDNGDNWVNVNTDQLPLTSVADVAVCPTNSNTIFIATGVPDGGVELAYSSNWGHTNPIFTIGVYRSFDYGQTWHTINTGLMGDFYQNGGTIRKMESDRNNPNIILLATSNGIYKTSNALASDPVWVKIFNGFTADDKDFRAIKFKPGNSNVLYSSSNNIFRSTNGGSTWESMTGPNKGLDFDDLLPFVPYRINIAVTPANNNRVFAYIYGKSNQETKGYVYYFNGTVWIMLYSNSGYFVKEWMGLAVSPTNADEYYFYGSSCPYASCTGVFGSKTLSWATKRSQYISDGTYADGHVLEFQPNIANNPFLFFGHHGGISVGNTIPYNSIDWIKKNNGLANLLLWSFDDSEFYKDIIVTAKQDHYADIFKNGQWYSMGNRGDSYGAKTSKVNSSLFFGRANSDNILYRHNIISLSTRPEDSLSWSLCPYDIASVGSKTHYTKTFQIKSPPNTNYDFFTFSELYKRKLDIPILNNWDPDHLWEVNSDIGKIEIAPWKRQLTEYDFCYTQPLNQYLANGINFNGIGAGYWFSPILAKTTVGGLTQGQYYLYDAYEQLPIPSINGEFPVISGIAVHPEDPNKIWVSLIGYDNISMRVAYSGNGGYNWSNADPTSSLPELPVNNIVYQYGSNEVLYIGTDAGIYYKDANMSNWERYGDFPNVRVTELKINYCQNKLRVATFGRSVWEADLMAFTHTVFYEIKAGEDIVWPKDKALHTSLKIKSGGKLTIGGFLSMPANSKIIVEEGAVLKVENGIISNKCGQSWQGIEVYGNTSHHQVPDINGNYAQGLVILNNATIENAVCAVNLWKPGDYTKTGGVLHATNSTFRDNAKSVHALLYNNYHPINGSPLEYNSTFNNCIFEITADYPGYQTFYKHIDLNQVNGLRFKGCDFSLSPDAQNVSDANKAIAAYNSGFHVESICTSSTTPCSQYDKSTFTGFSIGVYAASTNSFNTLSINRAVFSGNSIGVLSNNVNNSIIVNSDFYIAQTRYTLEDCTYGIYVEAASNFTIEENRFFKLEGSLKANYIGIGAFNCQAVTDVYKNEFTGLSVGSYAYGKNWKEDWYFGLEYICNTNNGNWADFYVTGPPGNSYSGIQLKQGNILMPARNTFSPTGATWHFYNETMNLIDYYYCNSCQGHTPQYVHNVFLKPMNLSGDCLSHYGGENPPTDIVLDASGKLKIETDFALADLGLQGVKTLYNNLKDGGDTEGTIDDLSNATAGEMWAIRTKLLGDSPHLTTEVLKLVADRTDVFTEATIFDILAANPDELKKEEIISYIEEMENPLPEYMVDILKQVAEGTSYRTVLELQMAKFGHERSQAAGDMIRSILNDEELDIEQLRIWLSNIGGIEAERQIISTYAQQGEYNIALALTETLPATYQLEGNDLLDQQQFLNLLLLQKNVSIGGRTIEQLTISEQNLLSDIAASTSLVSSSMAKSILQSFYGGSFSMCMPIDGVVSYKSQGSSPNQLSTVYGLNITVKPNPATEWTSFEYSLPEGAVTATLEIVDVNGKPVETIVLEGNLGQKMVDTRAWPAGQYIYSIKVAGVYQSGKLVIVKQ